MVKAALAQGIAESGDKKCAEVLPEIVDFEGEGHRLKQLESPSFQKWKSYNVSLFFFKKMMCFRFSGTCALPHSHRLLTQTQPNPAVVETIRNILRMIFSYAIALIYVQKLRFVFDAAGSFVTIQVNSWPPIALSLVLSIVQRYQARHVPCARICCTSTTAQSWRATCRISHTHSISGDGWLEHVTRMCTNAHKTQPIARSWDAYETLKQHGWEALRVGTVLAVSLGMFPRSYTLNETKRADGLAKIARRIGVLPVTRKFRFLLASLVLTSKASWGWVLNGLSPGNVMLDRAYKVAIRHPYTHLHSSTDPRKFFLWGHRSDLQFVAAQNLLVALTKWRSDHDESS